MKLFFTDTHIINLDNVTSVNIDRGIVNVVSGNEIRLTISQTRDIMSVMKELHCQRCERDSRA